MHKKAENVTILGKIVRDGIYAMSTWNAAATTEKNIFANCHDYNF